MLRRAMWDAIHFAVPDYHISRGSLVLLAIECLPRRLCVTLYLDHFASTVLLFFHGIVVSNEFDCLWVFLGELICECPLGLHICCSE